MPRLRWFKRPELDHLSLRLVALFLAVVLWFLAMDRPNTTLGTERRTIHVETRVEGAGPGIDVVQLPESVAVTVEGPRLLLPVQAGSVEAYVDVSGRGAGRHRLPVQVRVPANVNVTAVNPQEVDVVLEEIAEKRVPVCASVLGEGPEAPVRLEAVEPPTMGVYGPRSRLEQVAYVLAVADLAAGRERARAVPVDAEGAPVPGVAPEYEWVDVVVRIEEPEPGGP